MTLDEKIETAMTYLRARWVERGEFLSDSDLLDAADLVAPVDYDAIDAGDLDAELTAIEHEFIVERLYWHCQAEDEAPR